MSGNEQLQQQGSDDDAAPSTHSYDRTHTRINNRGVRHDVVGGAGNSGAGSSYQGQFPSQLEERGGAEPDGGWVDGDGWRMKAPTQKKRQQVVRGLHAAERVERERELERRVHRGRTYTTPRQGQAVATDGARSAAAPAAPLTEDELRRARIRRDRIEKYERKLAREEAERRAKAERDAPIQRKLERARRAQEKLEAKESRQAAKLKQTVRSSWQQRSLDGNNENPLGGTDTDSANGDVADSDFESRQIEAAVLQSLADLENGEGGAPPAPPAALPRATPAYAVQTPRHVETLHGTRRAFGNRATAEYWDPVLDGPIPTGLTDNAGAAADEGAENREWDAVLAEALSVVEFDVSDEIPAGANRERFRRTLIVLLRNMLAGNERRSRVRNDNAVFQENIGRWACGRQLMRMAGFTMERESSSRDDGGDANGGVNKQRGSYVWVARGGRSSGRLAMVQGLVEALEGQSTTATEGGRRGGAAEAEAAAAAAAAGWPPPPPARQDPGEPLTRTGWYAFAAAGSRAALPPPLRLNSAAEAEDEFTRVRREQDEAFEEALRRDREASASRNTEAPAFGDDDTQHVGENDKRQEEEQVHPPEAEGDEDVGGGRSSGGIGVGHGDGSTDPPPAEETAEQRRAKIALSYARLGLGS
ncbi:unnamed protein product [Ectocarpus sp. 4 AP-2014]